MKTWFLVAAVHAVLIGGGIGVIAAQRHNEAEYGPSTPSSSTSAAPEPAADPNYDPDKDPDFDPVNDPFHDDGVTKPSQGATSWGSPSGGSPSGGGSSGDGSSSVTSGGSSSGSSSGSGSSSDDRTWCWDQALVYTDMYQAGDITLEDYDILMQEIEDVCE